MQECLRVQVRGSVRLRCHAGRREVSRCHTIGESENPLRTRDESMQARGSILALKPRANDTRIQKKLVSVAPKKD